MTKRYLDLDAIQAFVRVVELGSFTRTAEISQTTQSAVSLKVKRLEERLGFRLIERTPRHVKVSRRGESFLQHARQLLEIHDRALLAIGDAKQRLAVGISEHVAGPELPALIGTMNLHYPQLLIEIRVGSSGNLLKSFDNRELDVVVARMDTGRNDGEIIAYEKFGWYAAAEWRHCTGEPIPIATMPEPCGVRLMAGQLLDEAGVSWNETFVGGGVATVTAAVIAGLGVAALAPRMLPLGAVEVGKKLGLPTLPRLPIILHSRIADKQSRIAVFALSEAFRTAARG